MTRKYARGLGPFHRNKSEVWLEELRAHVYEDIGHYPLDTAIRLLERFNAFSRFRVWDQPPGERGDYLAGTAAELIPVLRSRLG